MKGFKATILAMLLLTFALKIIAQKAVLDTNSILIGDRVALRLQVDIRPGKDIRFPIFDKNLTDAIEIVSQGLDTINSGKTLENILYITAFDDSVLIIPRIPIFVGSDTLKTDSLILTVKDFVPDSAFLAAIDTSQILKIRDLKPVMDTPWTFKEFWTRFGNYILIAFFSILLIAGIIYYIIRRRRNKPVFVIPKQVIPPHVQALAELDKLKEEKLWQKGKMKDYYTQLTDIVRIYIEKRFSVPAPEMTSYEILVSLSKYQDIPTETGKSLGRLLTNADLVKFAKAEPLEHENDEAMKNAYEFVEKTIPVQKEEKPFSENETQQVQSQNQAL